MVAIEYFISYFVMNPSQLHFVQILRYTHPTIVNVLVTLVHWVSKFKGDQDHVAPPPIIHIIITRRRRTCWNVFKNLNVIIEFSPFLLAQRLWSFVGALK